MLSKKPPSDPGDVRSRVIGSVRAGQPPQQKSRKFEPSEASTRSSSRRLGLSELGFLACTIVVVLALTAQVALSDQVDFACSFVSFDASSSPISIVSADFNGDAHVDLVAGNLVLLGDGTGFFLRASVLAEERVLSMAVADLNADSRMDAVVTRAGSDQGLAFLGNGDGTFGTGIAFAGGGVGGFIAAGDMNLDGRMDIAVSHYSESSVSVLLGNGDGTFGPRLDFGTGSNPVSLGMADLNHDGRLDVATACVQARKVSVHLGNGDGTFGPFVAFTSGANGPLTIGEFNNDGHLDVAVVNREWSTAAVLLGNGNGTFQSPRDFPSGYAPQFISTGDMNGDGNQDLVLTIHAGAIGGISILHGDGRGSFAPSIPSKAAWTPEKLIVGDLNEDGRADLAVTNRGSNSISVHSGNGNGTFGQELELQTASNANFVLAGDLNGDGLTDAVAAVGEAPSSVSVFPGVGNGSFGTREDYSVGGQPGCIAIGDFDASGRPDLAVVNQGSNTVSVLLGRPGGGFEPRVDFATGGSPSGLTIGDWNNDGISDLAVANRGVYAPPHGCSCWTGGSVSIYLGLGNGAFQRINDLAGSCSAVANADLNGDDASDLIAVQTGGMAAVYLGRGDGTFVSAGFLGSGTYAVVAEDLNGDGHVDVVVSGSGLAWVYTGDGAGNLTLRGRFAAGRWAGSLAVGDLDGDGDKDLVFANTYDYTVSVLVANGDGTFGDRRAFGTGYFTNSIAIGDFNNDGGADLVVSNYFPGSISLLPNRRGGSTGTLVSVISATALPGIAQLAWFVPSEYSSRARIYRTTQGTDWADFGEATVDASGLLRYEDTHILEGRRYGYRLGVWKSGGLEFAGEVWIDIPTTSRLALAGFVPNPSRGKPRLSFSLVSDEPARLEVLSTTGRVILTRSLNALRAGNHVVGLEDATELRAGIYFIRLTQAGRSITAKAVLL